MNILPSFLLTLIVIFVVPVLVYGLFVKYAALKEPAKKQDFMLSVLVQKLGTTFGFVLLFFLARNYFSERWLVYGLIWAVMFGIVEIGQAVGPDYTKKEALAGIISEFMYFLIAALILAKLLT